MVGVTATAPPGALVWGIRRRTARSSEVRAAPHSLPASGGYASVAKCLPVPPRSAAERDGVKKAAGTVIIPVRAYGRLGYPELPAAAECRIIQRV